MMRRTAILALLVLGMGFVQDAFGFYNPSTGRWLSRDPLEEDGGANLYGFVGNIPIQDIDMLGLLAASVDSIKYSGHGSVEKNDSPRQYIQVDSTIEKGTVPLNVTDSKSAASITAKLDDSFKAEFTSWTALARGRNITSLQLSTDLNGTIKVCCPCPFKNVRANWKIKASISGPSARAEAKFENHSALASRRHPNVSRADSLSKALDSSYCATFKFVLGQAWVDTSRNAPTTSKVAVEANFECME